MATGLKSLEQRLVEIYEEEKAASDAELKETVRRDEITSELCEQINSLNHKLTSPANVYRLGNDVVVYYGIDSEEAKRKLVVKTKQDDLYEVSHHEDGPKNVIPSQVDRDTMLADVLRFVRK